MNYIFLTPPPYNYNDSLLYHVSADNLEEAIRKFQENLHKFYDDQDYLDGKISIYYTTNLQNPCCPLFKCTPEEIMEALDSSLSTFLENPLDNIQYSLSKYIGQPLAKIQVVDFIGVELSESFFNHLLPYLIQTLHLEELHLRLHIPSRRLYLPTLEKPVIEYDNHFSIHIENVVLHLYISY